MLIDWLTMRLPAEHIGREQWERLKQLGDRIARYSAETGEVIYESQAWDSIRSDSHQISIRLGSDAFWIQGSPARICGDGCAVFGSSVSSDLNLHGCADVMKRFVSFQLNEIFPDTKKWIVSRVDVTNNIRMNSLTDVRQALTTLRNCEGGRYRVSQQAGDTVYWSQKSRLRKGKAYAKGPHLIYQSKQKNYTGRTYTTNEIELANKLLRLELTLGRQFFNERLEKPWFELNETELKKYWNDYFERMIGDTEMNKEDSIKDKLINIAKSEGQAKAAYGCWLMIRSQGWETAKQSYSKTTWYRHLKLLRQVGLGDADLSVGKVVEFRRKIIEFQSCDSWEELKQASA